MKLLSFLLFISVHLNLQAQIWKYPYDIIGIQRTTKTNYKLPLKYIATDSSAEQFTSTYYEYDRFGHKTLEIENELDTIHYAYDSLNEEILRIYGTSDSVFTFIKRRNDDKIIEKKMVRNGKINTTSYEYDNRNNIIKVLYNSVLYDQFMYDENNRLIKVENYYHTNHQLSEVLTYSYNGDTISYEQCPFDMNGHRYQWPCETTTGVLNKNGDVTQLTSIIYNGTSKPYPSICTFEYDEFGKILSMKINEYGTFQETRYFYDSDGYIKRIEVRNDQLLIYLAAFNILEK